MLINHFWDLQILKANILPLVILTILGKPPALPGRLPKFDIYGNIRKSPIM
jgi:hypothetical protein